MSIFARRVPYILGGLALLALAIKLLPLMRFGPFAFGHDYGFYRLFLLEPVVSFPNTPVPGLDHTVFIPRIVLDLARFLTSDPDIALFATSLLFSFLGLFAFWIFSREYLEEQTSYLAVLLFVLSGVQYAAYAEFFFKEVVALPFFIAALLMLERKKFMLAAALGIAVVLTHQTTSVLLIGAFGLAFVYRTIKDRDISLPHLFTGTVVAASYLLLHPHVAQKLASPPVGVFITQSEYLLWSLPVLLLAVVGARRSFALLKLQPVLAGALTLMAAFAIFHLPFYTRVYTFFDIFLCIPAALGAEVLLGLFSRKLRALSAACIVAIVAAPLVYLQSIAAPQLPPSAQNALLDLSEAGEGSAVITSPTLLPWVQGWSLAEVHAPGNLKEPHPLDQWAVYWAHQDAAFEKEFLESFPQPLYVFVGEEEAMYRPVCARDINHYLSKPSECPL